MKTSPVLIFGISMLLSSGVLAQPPSADWHSLQIVQTVEAIFPYQLQHMAVTSGEARVAISVDATGKLEDCLVTGYTEPEFAANAVEALKQWKFEPARLRGEAVGATAELTFFFEARGTVVSTTNLGDLLEAQVRRIMGVRYKYHPCSMADLDRIPVPLVAVPPQYFKQLAEKGVKGQITVEFFIDENGAVRMPAGSASDDATLTTLAVNAVNQWKFEPPTSRGKTVLVKASQVFTFKNGG